MATITGTVSDDYISSDQSESHQFFGGAGNDTLMGGAFADTLQGGDGDDLIFGGDGDDFVDGGIVSTGTDTLNGGRGNDRFMIYVGDLRFADSTGGVLDGGSGEDTLTVDGDGYLDLSKWTARNVEVLRVSSYKIINATPSFFSGFERIEVIDAYGRAEFSLSEPGVLRLNMETGILGLYGSTGNDTLDASSSDAVVLAFGGEGNDQVIGGNADDALRGNEGNDTLIGGPGVDHLQGESGNDTYVYRRGDGNDYIVEEAWHGESRDRILLGETITVEDVSMRPRGSDLWLTIAGPSGGVLILQNFRGFPEYRVEEIHFASGEIIDLLHFATLATAGDDFMMGGYDPDRLVGLAGNDIIGGLAGNDTLFGGSGNDNVDGWQGDDILNGGIGADSLYGGPGNDVYIVDSEFDILREDPSHGVELVRASVNFVLGENVEHLFLTGSAEIAGRGNDLANSISGSSASNLLRGEGGNDTLLGGGGDDRLLGGVGHDVLRGGTGGDEGYGGAGNDQVFGVGGNDLLYGGVGNDTLSGGASNDILRGEGGNDALLGDGGNDTLYGGAGRDTLPGGAGADLFVFASVKDSPSTSYRDTIIDFVRGVDMIDLAGIDAETTIDGNQAFTFMGRVAFSGIASELILWTITGTQDSLVLGDVNGDGTADFSIRLTGVQELAAGNFIL